MFEVGFLGTRAPFYMDVVTLYFGVLPFLLFVSILLAVQKKIKAHYVSQIALYLATLGIVLIFEIGVRLDGGYVNYIQESNISHSFFNTFLAVHILIAVLSVVAWSILLFNSYKSYIKEQNFNAATHKKRAKIVTLGLIVTSMMGVCIYYFLFVV